MSKNFALLLFFLSIIISACSSQTGYKEGAETNPPLVIPAGSDFIKQDDYYPVPTVPPAGPNQASIPLEPPALNQN